MNLLIDSHAIVWWMTADPRLSRSAEELLRNGQNQRCLSLASLWELSLKVAAGRLHSVGSSIQILQQAAVAQSISILPITYPHILRVERLPRYHADPFDRLLIAQAIEEGLTVLTADREFRKYPVPVVW